MSRSMVYARNAVVFTVLFAAGAVAAIAAAATAVTAAPAPASPATQPATRPATRPAHAAAVPPRPYPAQPAGPAGPLDFRVAANDGTPQDLRAYEGYVILVVNTASRCGLTPQYAGLQRLYSQYHDRKFVVLAFPANDFLGQEPGSDADILRFTKDRYKVTFPVMSKVSVKGEQIHPLYRHLTAKETGGAFAGDVEWNFAKFLIGRDGQVVDRFPAKVTPDDPKVVAAIEQALGGPGEPHPDTPKGAGNAPKGD